MTNPIPGQLHLISPKPLTAYEFGPPTSSSSPLVLFIAGLNDTLCSVPYLPILSERLSQAGWRLAQVCLSSAGAGWGGASVKQDAEELGEVVRYFRERGCGKVVLLGHSTGCQDAIAYAHLRSRDSSALPALDGIILQAPVSDREWPSIASFASVTEDILSTSSFVDLDAFVRPAWSSLFGTNAGMTYRRWISLALPAPSDEVNLDESEDFFSSDLSDTRLRNVFGAIDCPLLIVLSGEDETYPEEVKAHLPALLERFRRAAEGRWSARSGIVQGAAHDLKDEEHAGEFAERVVGFLREV